MYYSTKFLCLPSGKFQAVAKSIIFHCIVTFLQTTQVLIYSMSFYNVCFYNIFASVEGNYWCNFKLHCNPRHFSETVRKIPCAGSNVRFCKVSRHVMAWNSSNSSMYKYSNSKNFKSSRAVEPCKIVRSTPRKEKLLQFKRNYEGVNIV